MSVDLNIHRVERVEIERRENGGHMWTVIRMVDAIGRLTAEISVFGTDSTKAHPQIVDVYGNVPHEDA